ncbi:hypothetical protein H0H87_003696 [Tephrocybe sp. NHM501043]|nr:hypothetical protein H0H87_003696 [Tephrocybe sp. NHM501043]
MQTCLTFPNLGYYTNPENSVFGARGDFITSPEISQVFGELVGIWFLQQWNIAGRPNSIRLVELGPGRGTLMDDILRVISRIAIKNPSQGGVQLKEINLMEASPAMRKIQEAKLRDFATQVGCELNWHDTISSIKRSEAFTMIVAHEFFDALPFYQLQKTEEGWREVMVASTLDPIKDPRSKSATETEASLPPTISLNPDDPLFQCVLSPSSNAMSRTVVNLSPHLKEVSEKLPVGSFLEISVESFLHAVALSQLIGRPIISEGAEEADIDVNKPQLISPNGGGCGLIIDYGGDQAFENSFRAFKDHKIVDVFHQPGKTDLTANVDFALIKQAMGAQVDKHGPLTQSEFLQKMGMSVRVMALARQAKDEERRAAIVDAAERLVDPVGMGKEYKVYGFSNIKESMHIYPFDDISTS